MTENFGFKGLKNGVLNLFGHMYSKAKFYEEKSWVYNVSVNAYDCYPIGIETVIQDMREKVYKCEEYM